MQRSTEHHPIFCVSLIRFILYCCKEQNQLKCKRRLITITAESYFVACENTGRSDRFKPSFPLTNKEIDAWSLWNKRYIFKDVRKCRVEWYECILYALINLFSFIQTIAQPPWQLGEWWYWYRAWRGCICAPSTRFNVHPLQSASGFFFPALTLTVTTSKFVPSDTTSYRVGWQWSLLWKLLHTSYYHSYLLL